MHHLSEQQPRWGAGLRRLRRIPSGDRSGHRVRQPGCGRPPPTGWLPIAAAPLAPAAYPPPAFLPAPTLPPPAAQPAATAFPPPAFNGAGGPVPTGLTVVVERAGRAVLEVPVTKSSLILGRSDVDSSGLPIFADVDVSGHDQELIASRRHAVLTFENGTVLLEDLNSGNGTFVENVGKLTPGLRQPLPLGTRFMLGRGGLAAYCRA